MSSTSSETRHFQVVAASGARTPDATALPRLVLYKPDGSVYPIPQKQAAQADSTATDVAGLKTDFNALLAKLRLAGILA